MGCICSLHIYDPDPYYFDKCNYDIIFDNLCKRGHIIKIRQYTEIQTVYLHSNFDQYFMSALENEQIETVKFLESLDPSSYKIRFYTVVKCIISHESTKILEWLSENYNNIFDSASIVKYIDTAIDNKRSDVIEILDNIIKSKYIKEVELLNISCIYDCKNTIIYLLTEYTFTYDFMSNLLWENARNYNESAVHTLLTGYDQYADCKDFNTKFTELYMYYMQCSKLYVNKTVFDKGFSVLCILLDYYYTKYDAKQHDNIIFYSQLYSDQLFRRLIQYSNGDVSKYIKKELPLMLLKNIKVNPKQYEIYRKYVLKMK